MRTAHNSKFKTQNSKFYNSLLATSLTESTAETV